LTLAKEEGLKLENVKLENLGQALRIKVGKENTSIIDSHSIEANIKGRIAQIRT
jgi:chaperonin GroEL